MRTLAVTLVAFALLVGIAEAGQRLTMVQAKSETNHQMRIEASTWDYQDYVWFQRGVCVRQSATRINCGFRVYQRDTSDGPINPRSCNYIAHVRLPARARKPVSTVERLGCVRS